MWFLLHRKLADLQKKDGQFHKKPNLNHTDYAYREAVNRLKCMLNDSYSAIKQRPGYELDDGDSISVILFCTLLARSNCFKALKIIFIKIKVTGRPLLSEVLKCVPSTGLSRYSPNVLKSTESITSLQPATQYVSPAIPMPKPNNDLLHFIEKQEGYIEQLERESQFCRASYTVLLF